MGFRWDDQTACATSELGGLVVGLPRLDGDLVVWYMLNGRQRAFTVARVLADEPDRFAFVDNKGREHFLAPLTLDAWEAARAR